MTTSTSRKNSTHYLNNTSEWEFREGLISTQLSRGVRALCNDQGGWILSEIACCNECNI
jgi:hypothetical protein